MKRDLDLLRQIMRDVEDLQRLFGTAQAESLACSYRLRELARPNRRGDRATAKIIVEALRMQSVFGEVAARLLLERRGISPAIADRAVAGRLDSRQIPERRCTVAQDVDSLSTEFQLLDDPPPIPASRPLVSHRPNKFFKLP